MAGEIFGTYRRLGVRRCSRPLGRLLTNRDVLARARAWHAAIKVVGCDLSHGFDQGRRNPPPPRTPQRRSAQIIPPPPAKPRPPLRATPPHNPGHPPRRPNAEKQNQRPIR